MDGGDLFVNYSRLDQAAQVPTKQEQEDAWMQKDREQAMMHDAMTEDLPDYDPVDFMD